MVKAVISTLKEHQFLFEELVKRDFKSKYKRSVLGMGWSLLHPLLTFAVMWLVFSQFFGRGIPHFTSYLFCGNVMFMYFSEATRDGMTSLRANSGIFSKVNVPKYIFLLSKSVQVFLNFLISLALLLCFCAVDGVTFSWRFLLLVYPIVTMTVFALGIAAVLSALYIFFEDMKYLWGILLQLLTYASAIFYPVTLVPARLRFIFDVNPVYQHILYFRTVVLDGTVPDLSHHLILLGFAMIALLVGKVVYRRYNTEFLYYV